MCLAAVLLISYIQLSCLVAGRQKCQNSQDCVTTFSSYSTTPYKCHEGECICDPTPEDPCLKKPGEQCHPNKDCPSRDNSLFCDGRFCRCKGSASTIKCKWIFILCVFYMVFQMSCHQMTHKQGLWDKLSKQCDPDDRPHYGKFDPPRDMIVPGLFILGTATSIYFGFKLYCNDCWKIWRRRGRPLRGRDLEGTMPGAHMGTWVASYRVVETRTSPLYPPCLLLPVAPPPYEEALKHKVILSSYNPQTQTQPQVPL